MSQFTLPQGWVKFQFTTDGPTAYYNYALKVFTLSPPMDAP